MCRGAAIDEEYQGMGGSGGGDGGDGGGSGGGGQMGQMTSARKRRVDSETHVANRA